MTTLEWVWQRFSHTIDTTTAGDIERQLGDLRTAADEEDVTTVDELAPGLLDSALSLG